MTTETQRLTWGNHTLFPDPDPDCPDSEGWKIVDGDGENEDWYDTYDEAAAEARRLSVRDDIADLIDELSDVAGELDDDTDKTLTLLTAALAVLKS
jgi:hypothetical protein